MSTHETKIMEGGENRPSRKFTHLMDEFRVRADAVLADLPDDVIEQSTRGDRP